MNIKVAAFTESEKSSNSAGYIGSIVFRRASIVIVIERRVRSFNLHGVIYFSLKIIAGQNKENIFC